ncbi:DoxX-like family protein [Microbulbifer pacificus]|uniref:DoxX-like family protein n=1 Tax=Microbulbifer pacificus TaxID=407164 RepID=A0AAU0MZ83_9GAMM|nr:DoxX-like family protein [Microbulbifer pacificus]WOX05061.1 DoxX-like family protein [Microbulbifer pacificus]
MSAPEICRWIIGGSWIYHGLMPKIIQIAPLEQAMTKKIGFGEDVSYLITKAAGVGEILFGIAFIIFYRSILMNMASMVALSALLIFVAFSSPQLLMEAFNPVTTNIPLIALSAIIIMELRSAEPHNKALQADSLLYALFSRSLSLPFSRKTRTK